MGLLYPIKYLLSFVVYLLLFIVYVPIFVMGYLVITKNVTMLRLKKLCRFKVTYAKLGCVSRRSRVTDVLQVSTDEELDFQVNRSMAYVKRMTLWTPAELSKTFRREQTIELMSDEQLAYVILNTVYAHSVCWDNDREMYRMKMEGFEDLYLFEGFYWDARHVLVSADATKIVIQMDDGQEFHSDSADPEEIDDYNLAKLHVQICLSYFAPGLSHNHVHFVFPSAMCILSKTKLDRQGTLYRLLSPHFRFTERINYQALRVGKATNNKRSQLDRLFFFWQPFPVTKEQFMEGVARKCKKYYIDDGNKNVQDEASHPEENEDDNSSSIRTNGHVVRDTEDEEPHPRKHFIFPPQYITDPKLYKIPYLAFLREYYFVVRKYVQEIAPFIDSSEWEILANAVTQHVPRFNEADMIDALTTYIHQVGVVHYCDHDSYLRYFAYKYGCMAIRTPFETFKSTEHWQDVSENNGLKVEDIKRDPLVLLRQRDVMRTRCFLNLFVDYIPNPKCNMQLINTEYEFEDAGPKLAATNFLSRLRTLDGNLQDETPPIHIPTKKGDKRADGLRVTPLECIVRSVCF